MNFLEVAKKITSIESSPFVGTKDVVNYLSDYINSNVGLKNEVIPSVGQSDIESNILVKFGESGSEEKALLLLTHLDTTDPGSYGHWDKTQGNPFSLSIYGDELYGLGVTNKLDFICKLEALNSYKEKQFKKPVYLLGTHSEENGLIGTSEFLKEYSNSIDMALVSHPTDLNLYNEGLGIAVVEIEIPFSEDEKKFHQDHNSADNSFTQSKVFRGKSAHSSLAGESESAIVKLFDFLEKMPSVAIMNVDGGVLHNTIAEHSLIEFVPSGSIRENITDKLLFVYRELTKLKEKFRQYPHNGFATKFSTLNIGKIRSSKLGVVITGNCRLLPSVPEKEYRSWILELKQACSKVNSKFSLKRYIPSYNQNLDISFAKKAYSVAESNGLNKGEIKSSPICTEANLMKSYNIDCLLFGAGLGLGNSHQPNESISLSALKKSTEFYKELIGPVSYTHLTLPTKA